MNVKERFLNIGSYEEFDKARDEYFDLDWDDVDIINHYMKLLGETNAFDSIEDGVMIDYF